MNGPRLTLLETQHQLLVEHFDLHPLGHERGAVVLFRRLRLSVDALPDSDRYLAKEVILIKEDWINSSSTTLFDFKLAPLRDLFRRCDEEDLVFGFVHNHPEGQTRFSAKDDENEITLLKAIRNRNGEKSAFVAMLWANGGWQARVRAENSPEAAVSVKHVVVISQPLKIFAYQNSDQRHSEVHARGAAAFGRPFVDKMHTLRIGVVGTGGTGSPLATLLARSGCGELVLIDDDELARSNLNRVRGFRDQDVGSKKALKLREYIESIGLSIKVAAIDAKIDQCPAAVDALASCDVVFGCTDDFVGREVMNLALYAYAQLLIDMGLGGRIINDQSGQPMLRYHFARISTISPESGQCLFCQGVIKDNWIQTQLARRVNPNITQEELRDRYLEDGGEEAPGVGPFTSATADFALATLFDLIKPYRMFSDELRRDMIQIDFVKLDISSHQTRRNFECPYCEKHRFLLMDETYRLQRPMLGKRGTCV